MSRYQDKPLSFETLKTVPIHARGGKVNISQFARPYKKGDGVASWIDSLPKILAADSFRSVVDALQQARAQKKAILWGLGGHVVKCGLGDVLLDLMRRGWVTAFVMNGAASIHDFEIAIAGETSEDVEAVLPDGRFGAAEETGREMNLAISEGTRDGLGMGEALGRRLDTLAKPNFAPHSIVASSYRAAVPVTVHVAVGTDTPHTHPQADGAAIGAASHQDFRLLCSLARGLDQGGVYLNVGSAVVLPEVFLKAVSVVRNLGYPLANFTTVNFDFLQHYRPKVNVVERPHAQSGGQGYALTGHHELMIPLLAAALIESDS
jgi:Deoxyhypusine synthase